MHIVAIIQVRLGSTRLPPYIYRNSEKFNLQAVVNDADLSSMRWTADTARDLALVRKIFEHFGHDGFSWREVLKLLEQHP